MLKDIGRITNDQWESKSFVCEEEYQEQSKISNFVTVERALSSFEIHRSAVG
jgi:hypothetical protein